MTKLLIDAGNLLPFYLGVFALLLAGCSSTAEDAPKPAPATSVAVNPVTVEPSEYLHRIKLPEGFKISIYASGVEGARSMALGSQGTVFVGTRTNTKRKPMGTVYAITNPVESALAAVSARAETTDNLLPVMKDALRADCTLGEISDALRSVFGVYTP